MTLVRATPTLQRVVVGLILAMLTLVGCEPASSAGPPAKDGNALVSVSEATASASADVISDSAVSPAASARVAKGGAATTDGLPIASGHSPRPSRTTIVSEARATHPLAPTPTLTPDPDERRIPPPISYDGYPCDPYVIDALERWFWENTVRWAADGSAVFFSQGPAVYGAAVDGAWARAVADASGWVNPRLAWHPRVETDVVVGPMTYFDISPEGDRLVYATCAYREEAVTGTEQASAEIDRQFLLSLGYRPQYTGPFHPGYELAVVGLDGGAVERLTTNMRFDNYPAWSPDGTQIVYLAGSSVRLAGLVAMTAKGDYLRMIFTGEHILGLHPPQWSPDGTRLAVVGSDDSKLRQAVLTVNANGGDLRRLGRTISGPSWSPDGRRLAFVGATDDEGDAWGLLTMAADGTDVREIPLPPDWEPHYAGGHDILSSMAEFGDGWIPTLAWSPAGDQLLYTCGQRICVVGLDGTPVGRSPLTWRADKWDASGSVAAWSPDGTRIAVARSVVWADYQSHGPLPLEAAVYTMAPNGSDPRVLAAYDDYLEVRPLSRRHADVRVDVTGCAAGMAVPEPAANPGLVRDCETLLRAQAAWGREPGWSVEVPIQEWAGVGLGGSPPRVRHVEIHRQVLGPIPAVLSALEQLEVLDLSENVLGGTIPPELGQLSRLRVLDLSRGVLSGTIPHELGQLIQLDRLDLAYNNLGGSIPSDLGAIATLRTLDLENNDLTGTIPSELGQLPDLDEVRLGGNQLTGCLPAGLRSTENYAHWDQGLPRCEAAA